MPLCGGKVWKMLAEQKFDRAGLGGEAGDAGDVEVGRLGAQQEVAVEIDGRLEATGRIQADGNPGGPLATGVGVHAQREHYVRVGGERDGPERHRLERLLRHLPQHGGREESDLRALARLEAGGDRVAVGADHGVHRRHEIGIGEGVGDDAEHDAVRLFHADDRADADGGIARGPEMELMGRGRLQLGGDDTTEGRLVLRHAAMWRAGREISRGRLSPPWLSGRPRATAGTGPPRRPAPLECARASSRARRR